MNKVYNIYNKKGAVLLATIRKDGTLHFSGIGKREVEQHFSY
jgi:hypothetical protein